MRIDRSDPADGPGDVYMARGVRSATDDLDTTGKDKGTAVDGDGLPDSPPARPGSTLLTERTVAYRAVVDAAYRQYAIDHSDARAETLERETATPAVSRTDVEGPQRYLVGLADGLKGEGPPAEAASKSPQATDNTDGWMKNLTIGNGDHELYAVAARAFDDPPATASNGDGNGGNGGGTQPPAGDTSPDPEGEGDAPEGVNGDLGELAGVSAKDRAADLLAERINGEGQLAEADDDTTAVTRGGSATADHNDRMRDLILPGDGNHELYMVARSDDSQSAYRAYECLPEHNGRDGGDVADDPRHYSNPKTGRFDASWSTYDLAMAAAREHTGGDLGPNTTDLRSSGPHDAATWGFRAAVRIWAAIT